MPITANIDNIEMSVSVVSNNIDGVWRESYNINNYTIRLYRYGELYQTLSVNKGSSISLISVPTVQSGDTAHYGWTTSRGGSRTYTATQSITPTSDMDLHAMYSYSTTSTNYTQVHANTTVTIPQSGTCYFSGLVANPSTNTISTAYVSSTTTAYISIDGTKQFMSGLNISTDSWVSRSLTKGQVVVLNNGTSTSTTSYSLYMKYPVTSTTTSYRS